MMSQFLFHIPLDVKKLIMTFIPDNKCDSCKKIGQENINICTCCTKNICNKCYDEIFIICGDCGMVRCDKCCVLNEHSEFICFECSC